MKTTTRIFAGILIVTLVMSESVTDAHAGGISGVASEWTQILNNIQLTLSQNNQLQQIQNEFQQLANEEQLILNAESQTTSLINTTNSAVNGDLNQIFGPALNDMQMLSQIIQKGQGLAYSMANLDQEFTNRYKGFGYSTAQNYPAQYQQWYQTSLDTTHNTMNALGLQSSQLTNDNSILVALQAKSQSSTGMLQAIQAANQLAGQEVIELQKLRQLMMADIQSKQAFQAQQLSEGMSTVDLDNQFFAPPTAANSDSRTFSPIPNY